jgi:Mce-associated membrane protein
VAGVPGAVEGFARRRPRAALTCLGSVSAVLTAATVVFGVLAYQHAGADQARTDAKAAAENMAVQLLSYDYRAAPEDLAKRNDLVTGAFKDDYSTLMEQTVMPAAVAQKVSTRTSVTKSSIVSNDGSSQVKLLLFLNQTTQAGDKPDPQLDGSRVRMTVDKVDGKWLVSDLTPV